MLAPWFAAIPLTIAQFSALFPVISATPIASSVELKLANRASGEQLQREVFTCIREAFPGARKQPPISELQAASMQCVFEVVILTPSGMVRPDAQERLLSLMETTGVKVPQPISQGQATVPLRKLPNSRVMMVPVKVAGQARTFLLDTGASSSIVDDQTARQLQLKGTPISDRLLSYMVVGDHCNRVGATLYPLPALTVDQANVKGLMGLGLPQTAIPGKLSGVLGMDFLSNFDLVLNPKTAQLQLLSPTRPTNQGMPLVGRMGVMTAKVKINGQGPYTFALDTGADTTVISDRLAQRLGLNARNLQEVDVLGFCGQTKGTQTQLSLINVHRQQVSQLDALILDSKPLDLLGVEGIIGQNFLNRYQQHWRFSERDALGFPKSGSLELTPL